MRLPLTRVPLKLPRSTTKNIPLLLRRISAWRRETTEPTPSVFVVKSRPSTVISESSTMCVPRSGGMPRSEEHTSELQSRLHLVCRLLLEKKKKNTNHNIEQQQPSNKR